MSDRELDKVKTAAFLDSNAAFLSSLLCHLQFSWDESISTAGVDGKNLFWNRKFFDELNPEERKFILLHELWHTAKIHNLRCGNRNPELWNTACDLRINFDLVADGYKMPGGVHKGLYNAKYDSNWSEEMIYDDLLQQNPKNLPQPMPDLIIVSGSSEEVKTDQVQAVQIAIQQAKITGGKVPGNITEILNDFLHPKLPWWLLLRQYLTDAQEIAWNYARPNKRYSDIYMPSIKDEEGRLEHIALFLDTSGSISEEELIRFNSEAKYIQEVLNPKKLSVVEFDYHIHEIIEFDENRKYKNITIKGRGGTSLVGVREYILKNRPACSVIFSDLYCDPMERVPCPVIWVISGNHNAPSFGKSIRV